MATLVSGANSWLSINGKPLNLQSDDENQALQIAEYSKNIIKSTSHAPDKISVSIGDQILETEHHGIWDWNPKHFAGLYKLEAEAPGYEPQIAWIRVFPHKFTQRLYEKMKDELSEIALDLHFRLYSPASEKTAYTWRHQETSSLHDYQQARDIIEQMRDIMSHIRRNPYSTLHEQSIQQHWHEIAHFSNEVSPLPGASLDLPKPLAHRHGIRHLPESWNVQSSSLTYDTYENRLLKQFLQKQLITKLAIIQQRAENEKQHLEPIYARYHNSDDGATIQRLKQVIVNCQQMKLRCIHWSSEPFLKTVQPTTMDSKATQVLLKHPTYSRFYREYLKFQKRLKTTHDAEHYVTQLAMRRVSELYEMWSIFWLTRMAIEELQAVGYRFVSNTTFYEVKKDYFQFDVRKNVASIVLEKGNLRVEFKYEPVYPNQSTLKSCSALVATTMGSDPLTPDMGIEVYEDNEPIRILIFDAKYRWQAQHGVFYPKEEDIQKMYRYYNNIQYQLYQPEKARRPYTVEDIVTSAYILYPGNKIHSEAKNKIGALPLVPNMAPQRSDEIREKLKDLLYYAYLID
jgi:hypothetical protein